MKRLLIIGLMIGLAILLILAGKSFAQTTSSVTVSFTIPVMPGLNAPLIEENKTVKPQPEATTQQNVEPQKETKNSTPALIQTEKQEEKIVKTYYSR